MEISVLTTNPANGALGYIMSRPGVDVLSYAFTGTGFMSSGSMDKLDQALRVARGAGKHMTPRVRMGAGTPIAMMGRTMVPSSGVPKGKTIPVPVLEAGAPNVIWLEGFHQILDQLAMWCRANLTEADGPIHLSHFGGLSAELYVSDQMMGMAGVDQDTINDACVALVRLCAGMEVPNPVEVSYSGLEQNCAGFRGAQVAVLAEMVAQNAEGREFWTQRNGYTGLANPAAAPDPTVGYGLQMIKAFQPNGDPWPWATAIPKAENVARYLEIYDTSFGTWQNGRFVLAKGGAELFAACAR